MTTDGAENQRHLPIEGTHNFRDVGGYRAADGRAVRWRTLFRSDSLHRLTPASQRQMVDMGVRSIIDLRFEHEVRDWPNPFAAGGGLDYRHQPMAPDVMALKPPSTIGEFYLWVLEECQGRISGIMESMATSDTFPAVVHCAGGKDRTGILVALLLELLGVARRDVVEDYALTGLYITPLLPELMENARLLGRDMEVHARLMECRPEVMESTLDYLDRRYGGAAGYARSIGVGESTLDALRAALLDGPGDGPEDI